MLTKPQVTKAFVSQPRVARRHIARRAPSISTESVLVRSRLLPSVRASSKEIEKPHPVADSIGAFADDAGWDDFTASIDTYRQEQNHQETNR